jgi:hypothetical protein
MVIAGMRYSLGDPLMLGQWRLLGILVLGQLDIRGSAATGKNDSAVK